MTDGAAQWNALARQLAADPLFAALGLAKLTYLRGNQLGYDFDLRWATPGWPRPRAQA